VRVDSKDIDVQYRFNKEVKGNSIAGRTLLKVRKKLSSKSIPEVDREYWEYIEYLLNTASEYSQEEKNSIVEEICEYYIRQTGYQIPNSMLSALADFLLDEVLADPRANKVSKTEYPILSFDQLRRRRSKLVPFDLEYLDHFTAKEHYCISFKRSTKEISENK